MSSPNLPATQPAVPGPEVVQELIALQKRQFEIREQEIAVQQQAAETDRIKVESAHQYALKALDAQAADRKDERQHQGRTLRWGFWILLVGALGVFGLGGYALYANKDQLILEIVKAIVYAGGGGGVGFAVGMNKKAKGGQGQSSTP